MSKLFPGKWRTERSRNTVLVMSTQVHYLSHRTVQYGISCVAATSRVAYSLVATSCTYVSAINASSVSSVFVVCNRRKTLTGSPDPTYMQLGNKPCTCRAPGHLAKLCRDLSVDGRLAAVLDKPVWPKAIWWHFPLPQCFGRAAQDRHQPRHRHQSTCHVGANHQQHLQLNA